jgi:hypothetical protein
VPAGGRVPELRLGLGLGSFACFLSRGVLSKIVWITGDMPLMIGGVHQFFLDDDSSYDGLLMADFSMTISGQVQILQCLQFLEVDVSTAAI